MFLHDTCTSEFDNFTTFLWPFCALFSHYHLCDLAQASERYETLKHNEKAGNNILSSSTPR